MMIGQLFPSRLWKFQSAFLMNSRPVIPWLQHALILLSFTPKTCYNWGMIVGAMSLGHADTIMIRDPTRWTRGADEAWETDCVTSMISFFLGLFSPQIILIHWIAIIVLSLSFTQFVWTSCWLLFWLLIMTMGQEEWLWWLHADGSDHFSLQILWESRTDFIDDHLETV